MEIRIYDKHEIGTDDERALTKAIEYVFPNATRYLRKNILKTTLNIICKIESGLKGRNEKQYWT